MNIKLIIIAILVILVIALGGWYFYSIFGSGATKQMQNSAPDSTTNISAELQNTPDDASANIELNTLNQATQGF